MKSFFLMMALVLSVGFANAQNETQADKQVIDIEQIREKANQGDSTAQAKLAYYYSRGIHGVPKDEEQSLFWYKKAAESGHPGAVMAVVMAYYKRKDVRETQKWITKAQSLGINTIPAFVLRDNEKELAKIAEDSLKAVTEANRPEHEKLIEAINKIKEKPESEQDKDELRTLNERLVNIFKQRAIQKKDKALTFAIANGYEKGGKQGLPNMETGHYEYCEFVQSDDSAMVWYKKDVAFGGDPCNVERLNLYWVSKIIENHRKTIKLAESYLPKYTKKYGATNGTALYKGQFTGLSLAQVNEFVKDLNAMDNHYILRASEPPIDDVIRYGRGVQIYTIILQDGLLPVQTTFKVLNGKVVAQRDDNYKGMEGMKWFSTEALDNYKNDGWIHRLERIKEK